MFSKINRPNILNLTQVKINKTRQQNKTVEIVTVVPDEVCMSCKERLRGKDQSGSEKKLKLFYYFEQKYIFYFDF